MSVGSRALATLLVIGMLSISGLAAEPYSGEQTATGETWPSIEPYIQAPRNALELPEPDQPGGLAAGDVWPSRQNAPTSQASIPALVVDQTDK
jgi:hypothetical protein